MRAPRSRSARDARRRSHGQNFLASRALAERIVRGAGVRASDLVLEIGAGSGVLTEALARTGARVVAVEVDAVWAARLRRRFATVSNVEILEADALRMPLPDRPFRVVASIPFAATTAVLRMLLDDPGTPLRRADLIVQWEVARKRAGRPRNLVSASWSPWFRLRLGGKLSREAFRPVPAVDAGLLVVERRTRPLLPPEAHGAFRVFVAGLFSGTLARDLEAEQWSALFEAYRAASGEATGRAPEHA